MFIRNNHDFSALADAARQTGVLALDTEFMSGKTYYTKLCLLQVSAGDISAIIDPLEEIDLSPLVELLLDEGIVKVLHAAYQDIELMTRLCGRPPVPVFDTQVAATLAGFQSQIGYSRLLEELLDVRIDKSESYTDWSRRPLTAKQVEYALNDVIHLKPMYEKLRKRLEHDGRMEWLADDFALLSDPATFASVPEEQFRRVKRASTLNRRQLGILQSITAWRERDAQRRDLPRQWIIKDESLLEIARRKPTDVTALADIRGLDPRSLGDRGAGLLAAVSRGIALPEAELPRIERRQHAAMDIEGVVKLMGALVRLRSTEHRVAAPLLASQSDLEQLASGDEEECALLRGWRKGLIGEDLQRLLDGRLSLRIRDGEVVAEEIHQ